MTTATSNNPFASIRRNITNHRRNGSQNSATSIVMAPEHPTTTVAKTRDLTMLTRQQQRDFYDQQKKEAKAIWRKKQVHVRNSWQWPAPPRATGQIDVAKCYAERVVSTPDETLGDVTTVGALKRKRRVRSEMLEETKWNTGLRVFEQRRKAWTGAIDVFLPPGNTTDHPRVKLMHESPLEMLAAIEDDLQDERSDDSSSSSSTTAGSSIKDHDDTDPMASELGTTLIPYYMPILPGNFSLTQPLPNEAAETVLYKNLVTEGKAAIAPIPLANVVKACVTGLKIAEEWPPRPGMIDPLPGKVNKEKRRSRIKSLFGMKKDAEMAETTESLNEHGVILCEAGFESSYP